MAINIDQARKLHKLGVKKECEKSWAHWELTKESSLFLTSSCKDMRFKEGKTYYAYNTEELLNMIEGDLELYRFGNSWSVSTAVNHNKPSQDCTTFYGATLAEALANKLIYDIGNGTATLEEVNK